MNRRQALSLFASSFAVSRAIFAQENADAAAFPKTRAFLKKFVDDGQANGTIAYVHRRGRVELEATEGWLDAEHKIPMRPDAIFSIASMSKPITGVAAMILIEQGKIKLEDPIDRWLPELANRKVLRRPDGPLDDTYPAPRAVTVADLLTLHMGLGADGPAGPFAQALRKLPIVPEDDSDLWLKRLGEIPLQFAPGERWLNDTSVDVLGLLLRRVIGGTLMAFEQEHIFGPLGMKDTGFFVPPEKMNRVAGWPEGNRKVPNEVVKFEWAGDGMYSSAPDYLQFARMLLNKGELGGVRILKPASIAAMATDRLRPEEHENGPFFDRYPGRGFGYTMAVRTEPLAMGPSVGAFNWAGSTGVWFMIDPRYDMVILLMVQHPTRGENPKTGVKYVARIEENDLYQAAVYADILGA
jgi:CubicO group peptidase (beta-lactamase class C family)